MKDAFRHIGLAGWMDLFFFHFLAVGEFIYEDPSKWDLEYFCTGCLQSPINVVPLIAERVKLSPLVLTNYDNENELRLSNNGNNLVADVNIFVNATVTGGNNNELFVAHSIYFHWSSEHSVDFHSYDLEMQIVHYNSGYNSIAAATEGSGGFLNFAIFFVGEQKLKKVPPGIKAICDSLDLITPAGTSTTLDAIALKDLFTGLDLNEYVTYCGSSTIPPCKPNVIWIVFTVPLVIGSSCVEKFRTLTAINGKNMTDTRRPPQQAGGRRIFYNVPRKT